MGNQKSIKYSPNINESTLQECSVQYLRFQAHLTTQSYISYYMLFFYSFFQHSKLKYIHNKKTLVKSDVILGSFKKEKEIFTINKK